MFGAPGRDTTTHIKRARVCTASGRVPCRRTSPLQRQVRIQALAAPALKAQPGVSSLRPTMPAAIRPIEPRRKAPAGSPSITMPNIAVPMVPIPVHTA
jgi:hypothetical protein